jgi:predicted short-subunit dehydrogenase-like oxidoreductase (DUF2520 family)
MDIDIEIFFVIFILYIFYHKILELFIMFAKKYSLMMGNKIVILGLGNVGIHFLNAFTEQNSDITIWNRTHEKSKEVSKKHKCNILETINDIDIDTDLCIYCGNELFIDEICSKIPPIKGMLVHTAGSIGMDILKKYSDNYGVLYPLQTFNKSRNLKYSNIPIFIEASSNKNLNLLSNICKNIFGDITVLDSEHRKQLHIAAVFACNFTNASILAAEELTNEYDIDFKLLLPLIEETVSKLKESPPSENQTGPARRKNHKIIESHLSMLKDKPFLLDIYKVMTRYINIKFKNFGL